MILTFRNRVAIVLIRTALAILAALFAPAAIDAVGGCSGGSMGPSCTRLPDFFGSLSFGLHVLWLFSGFYFLGALAVPLLLLAGLVLEIKAGRAGKE